MIIVLLEKPTNKGHYYDCWIYNNLEDVKKAVNEDIHLDEGDSVFIGELPTMKEYTFVKYLVEKKSEC
jgi:hypothetical protein